MNTETKFLSQICSKDVGYSCGRLVREHIEPLIWVNGPKAVFIPSKFQTDGASVPRIPIVYSIWGDRVHREADLHDYTYRTDARIYYLDDSATIEELVICNTTGEFERFTTGFISPIPRNEGDWLFRVAMKGQKRSWGIYHPMYMAVRACGESSYHNRRVLDAIPISKEVAP